MTADADSPDVFLQDGNRFHLKMTNWGRTDSAGGDEARGDAHLFFGGLFIGAETAEGAVNVTNALRREFRPTTGPAGTFRVSFPGDSRGSRAGLGRDPDDDRDGRWDEDDLDGVDNDGDGLIDEDFETIGNEMSAVSFRDDQVPVEGSTPLGLEVRQRVFQWSNAGLETFVGLEFSVRNAGDQHLRDLFVGYYADPDLGPSTHQVYWTDDLAAIGVIDTLIPGPEPSSPPVPLSIPVVFMTDARDNGITVTGGDTPEVIGFFCVDHPVDPAGFVAPARVGLTSAFLSTGDLLFDPFSDADYYELKDIPIRVRRTNRPDDYRMYFGTGPFDRLYPGDTLTVVLGLVVGNSESDFRRRVVNAAMAYRGRFVDGDLNPRTGDGGRETFVHWTGDYPLPSPESNVAPSSPGIAAMFDPPARDGVLRVQWSDDPETFSDPASGVRFEGYQVWRLDGLSPASRTRSESPWRLRATYRLHPADSLGVSSPGHLRRVRRSPHVYEWIDADAGADGRLYRYAVTTLGVTSKWSDAAGRLDPSDVPGIPASDRPLVVMPAWPPAEGCSQVRVVPNPYDGSAPWDFPAGGCASSGARVAFTHLPAGWTRVDVYSLAGDCVFSGTPADSRIVGECETRAGDDAGGAFFWDLRNDRGDDVTSGIYLFVVEAPRKSCRGHFVIVR